VLFLVTVFTALACSTVPLIYFATANEKLSASREKTSSKLKKVCSGNGCDAILELLRCPSPRAALVLWFVTVPCDIVDYLKPRAIREQFKIK